MRRIRTQECVGTFLSSARLLMPWLLCLVLVAGLTAFAQERYGELFGEATDATGAVLTNAKVTARNKETNRAYTTQTTSEGTYIFRDIDPGRYSVAFELQGFSRYEVPEVLVIVGRRLKVDAKMTVGGTEQTVQVTESAPLIDVTGTLVATNVLAEEFDKLPKARSFQSLVLTAPSVNSGDIEGGFQVNGASGSENQFNIDGVSTTSLVNGRSRQNAVFEILQEVQIKTAGIDAEYGGALGGVISAITKSGGNAFHGDVHYYFSGNSISAGPNRRLLLDPSTERAAYHVQDTKFDDNSHEIGYSFGGPLVKDKLFFFSAASPRFRNASKPVIQSGGVREMFDTDQTYWQSFNKVSFAPWTRLRGSVQFLWTPTKSVGAFPTLNSFGNTTTTSPESNKIQRQRGFFNPQSNYSTQVDVTVTATSILSFRAGRFWDDYKTTGIPAISSVEYLTSATNLPFDIPVNLRQPIGFNNTPRLRNTFFDLTTRTYGQVDYSLFATFAGQHNIKVGYGRQKTVNKVDESYPGGGFIQVYWNSGLTSPVLGANQRGTYGYYAINDQGTRGTTGGTIDSLYIQDQWRILPRLTLTLGLRTENEKVPSFRRDIRDNAFQFDFVDKMAPRLGASYDLFGDGRVKLFGSYGRYYDWVKYELSRGTFGGDLWKIYYRPLETTDVFSLVGTNRAGRELWSGNTNIPRDRRVPSFDLIAKDLKPMSTELYNVGTEIQLGTNLVFRGSYVRNNLIRTIEDLGALDASGNEVYLYGNPGEGDAVTQPTSGLTKAFPMPKPVRKYDAMELSLTKRFSSGFFGSVNYTFSRLYGNYAGIASSDEITSPSTGLVSNGAQGTSAAARQGGNANRAWDLDEILFDSKGNLDVRGRLATDRPHVLKLFGSKDVKWTGSQITDVGVFFFVGSGTPLSTYVATTNQIPVFVNGRGDMGRTPVLNYTDLLLGHTFKFSESKSVRFEFNGLNLFNQKTARNRFNYLNRGAGAAEPGSAIDLHNFDLTRGYDYRALINASPDQRGTRGAYDPRYGLDDLFNAGFAGRFGVKFIF
jgi:hypothetical protein